MKPIAGLNRDVNPIDQPQDTMRYAANGVISESTGLSQNIRDELQWNDFDPAFEFIGQSIGYHDIYVFGFNAGQGEIWRYNPEISGVKELLIIDPDNLLDFDLEAASDKILQIVYQQDFEEHDIFAWAGDVDPKILDVGKILEDGGYASPTPIDLTAEGYSKADFLLFPQGELFNPEATALNSGGNVASGAWMFCYRYVYSDRASTNFSGIGNSVYIMEDSFNKGSTFSGDNGGRPTSKSIKIDFVIDDNQADNILVQFGYISIRDSVIFAGILDTKSLAQFDNGDGTATFIYTGENPTIDLGDNISELITPNAIYTHIGTITSLTSRLYAGNLTTKNQISLQQLALDIVVNWELTTQNVGGVNNNANVATFGPGEVYALYISALYDDGTESRAFHIPGRKWIAGDTDSDVDGTGYERYEIYDTVQAGGVEGYWANKNEEYPSTPDFAGVIDNALASPYPNSVRHHRLPTIGWMKEAGLATAGLQNMVGFNLVLSNIDFTGLPTNVIGYNIHYAKRKLGELVNLSTEWPTPAGIDANTQIAPFNYVAIAGGYGFSDEDPGGIPLTNDDDVRPTDHMIRFHGLEFLKDLPAISPLFIVKEEVHVGVRADKHMLVNSNEYTDLAGLATAKLLNAYKYGEFRSLVLHAAGTVSTPIESLRYVDVEDYAYVKNGVKYSFGTATLNNITGEDALVVYRGAGFNRDIDIVPLDPGLLIPGDGASIGQWYRFDNESHTIMSLISLRTVPGSISTPFDNQTLIFCKSTKKIGGSAASSITIEGAKYGDVFNGNYQWRTTGVTGMGPDVLGPVDSIAVINTTTDENGMFFGEGSKFNFILPTVGIINHNAQHFDVSDVQSYVPDIQGGSGTTGFYDSDQRGIQLLKGWYCYDQNIYQSLTVYYNDDFHRRPEYFISGINDGYFVFTNSLPTSIAFSLNQPTDIQIRQWRNWLLLNKYVQPGEKGEIINLKGAGNQMLYIHHRYSLYTTKDRISMQTSNTSVVVGSSNIFEVTPYEIVSVNEGHTGLKNRNWQSLSPFGYSWIQTDHGKVYIHDGKSIEEVSGSGMRTYFRDSLIDDSDLDEAFYIVNDDLRRRLIIGFGHRINDKSIGNTIAFSTTGKFWSFFQDMETIYPIIARDKRIFMWGKGADDHTIYAVAEGNYDNLRRPFIIEAVLNDGTSSHKYLQFIKWNTNVWSANPSDTVWFDLETETFNKIVIYSDTKIFGLPNAGVDDWDENLEPYTGFPKGTENVRRLEDNWSFNEFRDVSKDGTPILRNVVDNIGPNPDAVDQTLTWNEKSRMRDKYMIVRLFYDKANSNRIEIENIEFGIKPSFR